MEIINHINDFLWTYLLIAILLGGGLYFTISTRAIQFRAIPEMIRLLCQSAPRDTARRHITSFQAFAISLASRVGTGNIAGVAIAIALGGPGAVFWMWVVAIIGAANAFVESTLAQLYKIPDKDSFRGGPAYYISRGLHSRAWAVTFAVLITLTFPLAFNSVQSNTIADALSHSFGFSPIIVGAIFTVLTVAVIFGGIRRIANISQILVPIMAILYILLAIYVITVHISHFPAIIRLIVDDAFGYPQAISGSLTMTVIMGVKRGLFSNEAGEGSTPNAAATATISHPVKQGLVQTLGVYIDTLLVCTATAFIILCSGAVDSSLVGIRLTQHALETSVGSLASSFVAIAVILFAFTSIISNYYYGETNLAFINPDRRITLALRIATAASVMLGAIAQLTLVWALADITMALMTVCNMTAIILLAPKARLCLKDYLSQRRHGREPRFDTRILPPDVRRDIVAWPSGPAPDKN